MESENRMGLLCIINLDTGRNGSQEIVGSLVLHSSMKVNEETITKRLALTASWKAMDRKMGIDHELVHSKKKHKNEFTHPWIKFTLENFEQEIPLQGFYPTEINLSCKQCARLQDNCSTMWNLTYKLWHFHSMGFHIIF